MSLWLKGASLGLLANSLLASGLVFLGGQLSGAYPLLRLLLGLLLLGLALPVWTGRLVKLSIAGLTASLLVSLAHFLVGGISTASLGIIIIVGILGVFLLIKAVRRREKRRGFSPLDLPVFG